MLGAGASRRHIENRIRAGNTAVPRLAGVTYSRPARATTRRYSTRARTRRLRLRRIRAVTLLLVIAAIAVVASRSLVPSSSTTASPRDVPQTLPRIWWPADGQAAVQVGQSRVQAGPNQHP